MAAPPLGVSLEQRARRTSRYFALDARLEEPAVEVGGVPYFSVSLLLTKPSWADDPAWTPKEEAGLGKIGGDVRPWERWPEDVEASAGDEGRRRWLAVTVGRQALMNEGRDRVEVTAQVWSAEDELGNFRASVRRVGDLPGAIVVIL